MIFARSLALSYKDAFTSRQLMIPYSTRAEGVYDLYVFPRGFDENG